MKRLAPILDVLAPPTTETSIDAIGPRGWSTSGRGRRGLRGEVHNGVEYGLMQASAEGSDLFDKCDYQLDNAKIADLWGRGRWCARGCVNAPACVFEADGNDLHTLTGYTEDSGEGRWTIAEATARDVPTPAITASLYARLTSRGNGDYANRVLAALRISSADTP